MEDIKKILKNPMLYVALAYLILPVDFVPDAAPIAGTLDDIVPILISVIVQQKMSK